MTFGGVQRLPSWVSAFIEVTEATGSPDILRRWAAIACISGVLERKVWLKTSRGELYPNMYTVLTGPPGVGKSVPLKMVEKLWRSIGGQSGDKLHVAPNSLTKAALIDTLNDSPRRIVRPADNPPYVEFHSLLVMAGELGVLLPAYDNEFMNTLTDLYDGGYYAERRRTNSLKYEIEKPTLNILGGTTPSYLQNLMPEGAWSQGFASRTLFIYAGQQVVTDFFDEPEDSTQTFELLEKDLSVIASRFGEMKIEESAKATFVAWHKAGGPPIPDHPKLEHYLTRRSVHLLKLMMVAAHARQGNSMRIEMADYQLALNWLLEAEAAIPDIFRSMVGIGSDGQVQDELWHYAFKLWAKNKEPIPEHRLVQFLRERVPSHNVMRVLDVMVRAGVFEANVLSANGIVGYKPAPRSASF